MKQQVRKAARKTVKTLREKPYKKPRTLSLNTDLFERMKLHSVKSGHTVSEIVDSLMEAYLAEVE